MQFAAEQVKRESISRILKALIKHPPEESHLNYGQLVNKIGDHAFGLVAILFALPSALPISIIPGFSTIFGLPIVFISVHLILGRRSLWLPQSLASRPVDSKKLVLVIRKTLPYIMYIERFLKPRLTFFSLPIMERTHGFTLLILSLLLLLPIPFSNFILAGLIILFGLGIAERDGLFILLAYIGSLIYGFILFSVAHEIIKIMRGEFG